MLPSQERLRKSSLFQRTYAGRKSVATPLITLYVLPRQARSAPRLPFAGFVVAKRIMPKATQRNYAKRRVREAYRLVKDQFPALRSLYAVVFVIQESVLTASWEEVAQAVRECLSKATKRYSKEVVSERNSIKE